MRKLWQAVVVCGMLLVPHLALAQGTIAGAVRDESGAVLPGVSVQVNSPALIEGSREAVSDTAGKYSIVNLRPGTYTVTFTLTGFSTFVRQGIVLEGTFAAEVNAEMKVGALEETVTVSGESPIVDVRSATPAKVINRELMSALPAVRVLDRQAAMLPGIQVRIPVDSTGAGQGEVSMYGSKSGDSRWQVDGQPITFGSGGGGSQQALNDAGFEQVSFDDGSGSAEMSTGGVRINAIPKEGGNTFIGQFWANYAPGWQSENLTPELKALGVGGTNKVEYDFDFGPAYGGPIVRNKLWFFTAYRKKGLQQVIFNTYTKTGEPWVQRNQWYQTGTGRLTWQATKRDKIAFHYEGNGSRPGAGTPGAASGSGPNQPPEASQTLWVNYAYQTQAKWTSTPTNRLLLEASLYKSYTDGNNGYIYREDTDPSAVSKFDSFTGKRSDAPNATGNHGWTNLYSSKVAASYVTGSHSLKAGMDLIEGHTETLRDLNRGNVTQVTLINTKASTVTVDNSPFDAFANMNNDLGLFAQDTWTVSRLTFSGGVRWNWLRMSIPAQSAAAGNFVPARSFDAVEDVPNWWDFMPRFGTSWNVFGDGKTAIKGSVGKYVSNESLAFANQFSPLAAATDTRSWTDFDNNGSVFDTGTFNVQVNEIGPPKISNFGSARATARLDPDMKRAYNWSYSLNVQRELFRGISVNAGYYHRDYHNCAPPSPNPTSTSGTPSCSSGVTRNLAVNPVTDYTAGTFVGPVDPKLPNGGGEVITWYNLVPNKLGATDNIVTYAKNTQTFNGVDFNVNARLPNGGTLFGGITSGSLDVNTCDVNNPNELRFCETKTPWQPEYKLAWNYPLPLKIWWSGTIRTYPGTNVLAIYAASSKDGVNLTGGGSLSVQLMDPTDQYLDAVKAFDMRFSRTFRLNARMRIQAFSDIINVPNVATIGGVTNTYGSNWLSPLGAPGGRFVRFGTQFDF